MGGPWKDASLTVVQEVQGAVSDGIADVVDEHAAPIIKQCSWVHLTVIFQKDATLILLPVDADDAGVWRLLDACFQGLDVSVEDLLLASVFLEDVFFKEVGPGCAG